MGNRPYIWREEESHAYDDIINLPHYVSSTRPHMTMLDRAAQFSPYAALTGYDEEISETARLTDRRDDLTETQMAMLNEKLALLEKLCSQAAHEKTDSPLVTITYFMPDTALHYGSKKDGGAYLEHTGKVKRVDLANRIMVFEKNEYGEIRAVDIDEISDIRGAAVMEIEERYE